MARKSKLNKTVSLQEQAQALNLNTYNMYLDRLTELSIALFKWENLPETVDERFLEITLFGAGCSVFFLDDVIGYLALNVTPAGPLDIYNVPIKRRAYATNGYQKFLDGTDSVIIYNNALRQNTYNLVCQYAFRLALLERAIDVNVNGQKTPIMIQCSESQRLTMQNLYMKYDGFEPFIFGDKNLDLSGVKVLPTNVPFNADKLQIIKRQVWQEALGAIGVESIANEKAERLITAETLSNYGAIATQRFTRYNARKQACEKINRMFGLNLDISFREITEVITPINAIKGDEVAEYEVEE